MFLTPLIRKGQDYFSEHGIGKLPIVRAARDAFVRHCGLSWWKITEPTQTQVAEQVVRPGDTVVDIGANIGYYTLKLSERVGENGRVFAFEPEPKNFRLLECNVARRRCGNVTLVQKAVAPSSGTMQLFLSPFNPGDHRIYDSGDGRQCVEIATVRLDEYFQNVLGPIDFVKIDVQGAEGGVIESLGNLLDDPRTQRLSMMTEYWPSGLQRFGTHPQAFLEKLRRHGFTFQNIDEQKKTITPVTIGELLEKFPLTDEQGYTNLLCTRNKE